MECDAPIKVNSVRITTSFRNKYWLIFGVMLGCYVILYPQIIHKMILFIVGTEDEYKENEFVPPQIREKHIQQSSKSNANDKTKVWLVLIPLYGAGFFIYFLFQSNQHSGSSDDELNRENDGLSEFDSIFGKLTLGSKYKLNGLDNEAIRFWGDNDPKIEQYEHMLSKEQTKYYSKRTEIRNMLTNIKQGNCVMNDVSKVLLDLRYAEIELMKMMDNIHKIQYGTILSSSRHINKNSCSKETLEEEFDSKDTELDCHSEDSFVTITDSDQ